MTEYSIIIQNPLPFMIESYMKKNVLEGKYSSGKMKIILKYDLPKMILISFEKEDLQNSYINDYNGKFFDDKLVYELKIEKTTKTSEELQKEAEQDKEEYEPFNFEIQYENEWKFDYVNSPEKPGLLYINEEAKQKVYKSVKFLITKFGKNLFEGKSIINVSFPIFLYDKRTYAQVFAYEHRLAPYFLSRAALSKDKMERFKWVITHLMAFLHISTAQTQPFKPVVGETFQCRIGDFSLYLENTTSEALINNFYGFDDNRTYKIYGYLIYDISTNPTGIVASKVGNYYVEFKDGSKYLLRIPNATLKGVSLGERTYNYTEKALIYDLNSNLCAYIEMNPEEVGFFKSFFKKKNTFPDFFKGDIVESSFVNMNPKSANHSLNKGYKSLCKIEGEWTSSLRFDDEEYWDIEDYQLIQMYHNGYLCPSDSSLRLDLINFIKNDQEQSQKEKEKIEEDAEKDITLRKKKN